ncbi:PREDICTED: 50S ribosomal protein L25 [Theobroma cacao]|uniref:50S ribosomal protein L25 n=1 Tax=Theobroma cacao TaxID=3641 RepID=A0AB32VD68_THECC|nr:PREDICTED: 50S ribosomal protein L25 [Theobroma cacao]
MATLIHRTLSNRTLHLRFFSQAALALDKSSLTSPSLSPSSPFPLTYLEGFPKPDPKYAETILAIPRATSGKSIAAKERKVGRLPSIVFEQEDGQHGGNKRLISVQINQIRKLVKHLGQSFFLSRLFDLEVRSEFGTGDLIEKVRVLPRKLHLHAGTDAPLNVTFIRAPSHALLKVDVPVVFRGEDVSPGLRKGSYLNIIKRTLKFRCPADIVPPYIDVDLSELDVGQKLVMGDLEVHPALKLIQSKDEPVVKIMGARVSDQQRKK